MFSRFLLLFLQWAAFSQQQQQQPNIVIIYMDDLGYADISCYGSKNPTPNIDRLATEGVRFTDFYAAQPVCSASRASLLTGCYPNRIGIHGALMPTAKIGISSKETTLAELFKSKGYKTGMVGKWHLGHHQQFLPIHHGFDSYFGLPYSNDMWPKQPKRNFPRLPLIQQDSVIGYFDDNQDMMTTWYTEHAVSFIEANKSKPFFLYLAHSMPHVPLFVAPANKGKSGKGIYADVMAEMDWSVGEVLATLKKFDLEKNTLVIFASDNGPWLSYGDHAGSALPLREGKGTVFEGGVRVPCIMKWPGKIPAGKVQKEPAMTIDILPTIARLIGAALPENDIDGKDIWSLITTKKQAKSPQEAYYFYYGSNELLAMRMGPWKLYFPHTANLLEGEPGGTNGIPVPYKALPVDWSLYNLNDDISEIKNVASEHPEIMAKMKLLADKERVILGDKRTGIEGSGTRLPGSIE